MNIMKVSLKFTITLATTIASAILLPTASSALEANSSSLEINLTEIDLSFLNPDDYECDSENTSLDKWQDNVLSALTEEQQLSFDIFNGPVIQSLTQSDILFREASFYALDGNEDDPPALFYGGKKQGKALFKELDKLRLFWNFPDDRKVPMVALRGENALDKERMTAWFLSVLGDPEAAEQLWADYSAFLEANDYDASNPLYTLNGLALAPFQDTQLDILQLGIIIGDGILQYLTEDGTDLGNAAVEYLLAHEWG